MLRQIAEKIEKFINCSSSGSCGVFAAWVSQVALKQGVSNFKIVFGHVKCRGENGNWVDEHIWIEDENGKIDPTVSQFFPFFQGYSKTRRKKYSPEEILSLSQFSLKNKNGKPWIKKHLKKMYPDRCVGTLPQSL